MNRIWPAIALILGLLTFIVTVLVSTGTAGAEEVECVEICEVLFPKLDPAVCYGDSRPECDLYQGPNDPSNTTTTVCYEDMPCWDCKTMGNKICGVAIATAAIAVDAEPMFTG